MSLVQRNAEAIELSREPAAVESEEEESSFDPTANKIGSSCQDSILKNNTVKAIPPRAPVRKLQPPARSPVVTRTTKAKLLKLPASPAPKRKVTAAILQATVPAHVDVAASGKGRTSQPLPVSPAAARVLIEPAARSHDYVRRPNGNRPASPSSSEWAPPKPKRKRPGLFGDFCIEHPDLSDFCFATNSSFTTGGSTSFLERLQLAVNTGGNTTIYDVDNSRYVVTSTITMPRTTNQAAGNDANAASFWCNGVNRTAWMAIPAVQYRNQIYYNPIAESDIQDRRKATVLNVRDVAQDIASFLDLPNQQAGAAFADVFTSGREDVFNSTFYLRAELEALKTQRRARSGQLETDLLPIGPVEEWADIVGVGPIDDDDVDTLRNQAVNHSLAFVVGEDILTTTDLACARILTRAGHGAAPQVGPVTVVDRLVFPQTRPVILIPRNAEMPEVPDHQVTPTAQEWRSFYWRYANNWGQVDACEAGVHSAAEIFASRWQQAPAEDFPREQLQARRRGQPARRVVPPPPPRRRVAINARHPPFDWENAIVDVEDLPEHVDPEPHPQQATHQVLWNAETGAAIPNCYVAVRPTLEASSEWFLPAMGCRNLLQHMLGYGRRSSEGAFTESANRLFNTYNASTDMSAIVLGAMVSSQATASLHSYNLDGSDLTMMQMGMHDVPQSIQQVQSAPLRWSPASGGAAIAGALYKHTLAEGMMRHYNLRVPMGMFAGQSAFNILHHEEQFGCAAWANFFSADFAPQLGSVLSTANYLQRMPCQYGITPHCPKVDMKSEVIVTGPPVITGVTTLNGASNECKARAGSLDPFVQTPYGALSINVATQKAHMLFEDQDPVLAEDFITCPRHDNPAERMRRPMVVQPPFSNALSVFQPCTIKSYRHRENVHTMPAMTNIENPQQFQNLSPTKEELQPYVGLILNAVDNTFYHASADSSDMNAAIKAAAASVKSAFGNKVADIKKTDPPSTKNKENNKGSKKSGGSKGQKNKAEKEEQKEETFQQVGEDLLFDPLWLFFLSIEKTTPPLELEKGFREWRSSIGNLGINESTEALKQYHASLVASRDKSSNSDSSGAGPSGMNDEVRNNMYS